MSRAKYTAMDNSCTTLRAATHNHTNTAERTEINGNPILLTRICLQEVEEMLIGLQSLSALFAE